MNKINAMWESQFYVWPFENGQRVKLLVDHNGRSAGRTGYVDLSNPNYFWAMWDDGSYSSFNKNQMHKLEKL